MKIKPGIAISTDGVSVEDQRAFVDLCIMNGGKKRINEAYINKNFIAWGITTNNVYFCDSLDGEHIVVSIDDALNSDWHSRGELPPVGTKCVINTAAEELEFLSNFNGLEVEIVQHSVSYEGDIDTAVFRYVNDSGDAYLYHALCAGFDYFRPLKTERERAIEEMYSLLEEHALLSYKDIVEMLYDAGYRKGEK